MDQQLSSLPPLNPLGYLNSTQEAQVLQVRMTRAPTTSDRRYKLGTLWTDTSTNNVYLFTNIASGNAIWESLGGPSTGIDTLSGNIGGAISPVGSNIDILGNSLGTFVGTTGTLTYTPTAAGYPITPYVVGASGEAGYTTIQSAINAAHAAGQGTVYIQGGSYIENLTLYDQVNLVAVPAISQGTNAGVLITGIHIPPTSGHVLMNGICFASSTHVLSSVAAGTTHIVFANCESAVQNGYLVNLPNWSGIIEIYDCNPNTSGAPTSINDGGINNTGGATVIVYNSGIGSGTNVMTISGANSFFGQAVDVGCPMTLVTGANVTSVGSQYLGAVTLSNNSVFASYNDSFITGAAAAITMSSSGACSIENAVIFSSNNPAIAGAGAGILTLGGITFTSNSSVAGTLTLAYDASRLGSTTLTGNLIFNAAGNKILSTSVASTTTAGANSFGTVTLAGGTATVNTTAVTASSIIYLFRQGVGATGAAALGILSVGTITAGASFVINAVQAANATALQASDVSVIGWMIVN